jgi:hypothetical protein
MLNNGEGKNVAIPFLRTCPKGLRIYINRTVKWEYHTALKNGHVTPPLAGIEDAQVILLN